MSMQQKLTEITESAALDDAPVTANHGLTVGDLRKLLASLRDRDGWVQAAKDYREDAETARKAKQEERVSALWRIHALEEKVTELEMRNLELRDALIVRNGELQVALDARPTPSLDEHAWKRVDIATHVLSHLIATNDYDVDSAVKRAYLCADRLIEAAAK